jgi:sporulation protein YabP
MPVIEEKKVQKKTGELPHNIVLENRQKLNVSGIYDVDNFDESSIEVYTSAGFLTIHGNDLHISKLNIENGEVSVEGEIWSMEYSDGEYKKGAGGFFSKLFR